MCLQWDPPRLRGQGHSPSFKKPHSFPVPNRGPPRLPGWLVGPSPLAAKVRVLLSIPAAPSRALHMTEAGVRSGCPQVILCSPVQPLRRPGPNSRTLRPRQPWAGQPTCLPRRLAEFTAHRPGSKGARPVILWQGAGADDGPMSGTRLFTVTPSAPGPSTGGSVLLPRVPSSGARDPPCVAGVLPRGQGGQY